MKLNEDVNEFGTPVSVHKCDDCGDTFTVCPPAGKAWGGCLSENCVSYDIKRDADKLFENNSNTVSRETIQ